jgi:hypothetical protein
MTLQKQLFNIPITGGKDDSVDPLLNAEFASIDNMLSSKQGSLTKRTGYRGLTSLGSSATDIFSYGDELLAVVGNEIFTYSDTRDSWINKGNITSVSASIDGSIIGPATISQVDYVELNGVGVYVYIDTGDGYLYADVLDVETGARFQTRKLLSSTTVYNPICVATGVSLMVLWGEGTAIKSVVVSTESPESGVSATASTISDLNGTSRFFDACALGSNFIVAYKATGGNLKLAYITQNNIAGSPLVGLPVPLLTSYTLDGQPGICSGLVTGTDLTFSVTASMTGNHRIETYNSDLTLYDSVSLGALVGSSYNRMTIVTKSTSPYVVEVFYTTTAYVTKYGSANITAGTEVTPDTLRFSSIVMARPIIRDGVSYILLGHYVSGTLQETLFLLDVTNLVLAGRLLYSSAGSVLAGYTQRFAVAQVSGTTTAKIAVLRKARIGNDFIPIYGVALATLEFAAVRGQLDTNGVLLISGGFAQRYDGDVVTEMGFLLGPDALTAASTPTTGGSMSNGTYYYQAVYEWIDRAGNIERSLPSPILTVTLTGGTSTQRVVVSVPTLPWTQKYSKPAVVTLYRTQNAGTIFYKVSSDTSPVLNRLDTDLVQVTDTLADASLPGRQLLYTTGNVLENVASPGFTTAIRLKQRVFVAGGECDDRVYYSKQFSPGVIPEFSDLLYIQIGSAVTALAELDDKLIIFTAGEMFVVSGEGPNQTGVDSTFSAPFRIAADVGCTIPESIATTPMGLMFMSSKGIYLLDRGMNCTYIGEQAENINDLTVVGSVVNTTNQEVLFMTLEGTTSRFDWKDKKWTTYSPQPSLATLTWKDKHTYLRVGGTVMVSDDSYLDDGASYNARIETGWLQLGQVNGFQRVWSIVLLGRYIGEHRLVVRLRYDHRDSDEEVLTIDPNDAINGTAFGEGATFGSDAVFGSSASDKDGVYRFQVRPGHQKCQAMKLIIEDAFIGSAADSSFDLAGITLVVGVRPTYGKQSAGKRLT